jgi:hypothetical protein
MTITVGVMTPRPGQGSSTWALALAWEIAETSTVLLVDADPQGGTIADQLALPLEASAGQVGMARLFGPARVSAEMIEANSIPVARRSRLRVVPGVAGYSGPVLSTFLPKLREPAEAGSYYGDQGPSRSASSLLDVSSDVVIVDLGAPLAHPDLQAPERAADAIATAFQRVFIVIRDAPGLLPYNLSVLRAARLAKGELILACRGGRRGDDREMRGTVREALGHSLPEIALGAEWEWNPEAASRAEQEGVAMPAPGLAASLGLNAVRP